MNVKGFRLAVAVVTTAALTLASLGLSGCAGMTGSKEIPLTPKVNQPAVGVVGTLKVGVDSTHAPFAGIAKGELVGIDVDIAAALATELGLKLQLVDIANKSADTLLNDGTVDIVMDVEQTGGSIIQGTQVGPYLQSGPALFTVAKSSTLPTIDLQALAGTKIAAQKDSLSSWSLDELIGKGTADPKTNLSEAFKAVESGASTYAAADAIVGSYLAVDYNDVACVKVLGTPIGVYVGVAKTNTVLPDPLAAALRTLRDNGTLKTILSKWLGPVSANVVMGNTAIAAQSASKTSPATVAPGEVDAGDDLPDPSNAGGLE
jgi:polar amino acid transport system substrate-binding protein